MKALPFPCIRPAQDRVLEALPAMRSILSDNEALRDAIADGLMLKDPGAAYYVYECSGEPGRVTGIVAICPVNVLMGSDEAAAESVDALAAARAIAELKVQPRPVSLAYEASPVMDIILGAAKRGVHRSTPSPIPQASRIACGRSSARTLLPPSAPCSIRRPTRCSPVTPPIPPHWLGHRRFWPTRPAPPASTLAKSRSTLL